MIKTTKRRIFILLMMLCIAFAFVIGCGDLEVPGVGGGGGDGENDPNLGGSSTQVAAVVKSSIKVLESSSTLVVEWDPVPNATSYRVTVSSSASDTLGAVSVTEPTVDLRTHKTIKLPASGTIKITLIAKRTQYKDSVPVTITYELEGALLLSPEINSFNNGIIGWKEDSAATSYIVKVNGTAAEVATNSYDVSNLSTNAKIEIAAKIGSRVGATTAVMYDATAKKLSMLPITDYTVDGDILKWKDVGGAVGYKVVDLDFNSYTVTTPYYIMAIRNIIYGVYPVMSDKSVVGSAEVAPVDIKYLEGSGTVADPYVIKTPFDLRTIDYYELKYSETAGAAKNYYIISADMNYNTVSALESDSNMFTLRKPFFGTLDGGNKTLSNISVHNSNGFWAMFEFIATGGTVKNIKFDNAVISNSVLDTTHPINASIAMVANRNYGTVSGISLGGNSRLTAKGGGIGGIVLHNYGTVNDCAVDNCTLRQDSTTSMGTAAYEMAGVVLENYGTVSGNNVNRLTIIGTNIGSSAGVVSINRAGGTVGNNSFNEVKISTVKTGKEAGGLVAYCATGGNVNAGTGTLGTLTVNSGSITTATGTTAKPYGKQYGKKG